MKRKIVAVVLVLLLAVAFGAFAKETKPSKQFPWMASFNQPGQVVLYAAAGFYGFGFDLLGGPEFIIGAFNLGGIPLEWGVTVKGMVGFASFLGYASWVDWGVDFGSPWKFDWYIGAGLGISGSTGTYYKFLGGAGPWFGFATSDGVAWHFSDNFALIADYAYTGLVSVYGIGVKWNI